MTRNCLINQLDFKKICIIIHKQECPKSTTNLKSLSVIKDNLASLNKWTAGMATHMLNKCLKMIT